MGTGRLPLELSIDHIRQPQRHVKLPLTVHSLPELPLLLDFARVAGTNVHFHIVAAIGPVWAVGALERFVGGVGDHVVLEVLALVAAGDDLATDRA